MDNRKMGTQRKLSTSVALCTYNSEKYVLEQLDSILAQTVLPDEIIVSDDASQDKTKEILNSYVREHSSCHIEIKLMNNEQNLGYSKNFERCFQECRGDIIISCDADDVWCPDKVKKMLSCFDDQSIVYAFHDAKVVDAELNTLSESLYGSAGLNWSATNEELLIRAIKRQGFPWGMTMAFRSSILERAVPFSFAHDGWIWMCALCTGGGKVCR